MVIPELVDGCNLRCELCWNKTRQGSFGQMSVALVEKILKKYAGASFDWFNWGEPLLHTELLEISRLVKGTKSRISSNLSFLLLDNKLEALLNFQKVYVSLSGMTPRIYGHYHHGGNHSLVMENLLRLSKVHKNVVVRWLEHPRNNREKGIALEVCTNLGVKFESVRLNCLVEDLREGFTHEFLPIPESEETASHRSGCRLMRWVPISVRGEYLLCCASKNVTIGYTINDNPTEEQLISAKMAQPLCRECRKNGHWRIF